MEAYHKADNIGPGVWYIFHMLAYEISYDGSPRKNINDLIDHIRSHFPCLECRGHFKNLTDNNPLVESTTSQIFQKVYIYHKIVNGRLNKDTPKFETILEIFEKEDEYMLSFYSMDKSSMGIWWVLHSLAAKNKTLFLIIIDLLRRRMAHDKSKEMLINATFLNREDYPRDVWLLHSSINEMFDKENLNEETVITFFDTDEVCSDGCTSKTKRGRDRYIGH